MMLVIEPLPPAYRAVAEHRLVNAFKHRSISQGNDGQYVEEKWFNAIQHSLDRAKGLFEVEDDLDTQPVRPRNLGTVQVKYLTGDRMKALPFEFDDE